VARFSLEALGFGKKASTASPVRSSGSLRYEVQLVGLTDRGVKLRSRTVLIGNFKQCKGYEEEHSGLLAGTDLQFRVRPSSGLTLYLDPDQRYPQEVESIEALVAAELSQGGQ